jgi:hypothetical protein
MIAKINILVWLGLFVLYFAFDILYTMYVMSVSRLNALSAANISALLYVLTAIGTVLYVENWLNIIPILVGAWCGTFLAIKHEEKKQKKSKNSK